MKKIITIGNTDYIPVFSLRSQFIFEELSGHSFEIKTMMDTYIFFYSCIIANKENNTLDFESFIDFCDVNPQLIVEFKEWIEGEITIRGMFSNDDDTDDKKKV